MKVEGGLTMGIYDFIKPIDKSPTFFFPLSPFLFSIIDNSNKIFNVDFIHLIYD